jgi:hypothetical protein
MLLGLGGATPGLLGATLPAKTTTETKPSAAQTAAYNDALAAIAELELGATGMWDTGSELLTELAKGTNWAQTGQQGLLDLLSAYETDLTSDGFTIPDSLRSLVESAYEPAAGSIATQAIESARKRGFAGGADLLNTGPGGAIAGPALSDLAGHESESILKNLFAIPTSLINAAGAYDKPITQLTNIGTANLAPAQKIATDYGTLATGLGTDKTTTATTLGSSLGQAVAGGLSGAFPDEKDEEPAPKTVTQPPAGLA